MKKLSLPILITIAIISLVALYFGYRLWAISIIKANLRKANLSYIEAKAAENGVDVEKQLQDDAVWVFNKTGFEWYS